MRSVLLLDTNILIHLAEQLYDVDKGLFDRVFSQIRLPYSACWIPNTVKNEFLSNKKHQNKLQRRLAYLQERYSVDICPITVSQHEILGLTNNRLNDQGEADALLQIEKLKHSEASQHQFGRMLFCSRDKKALQLAERLEIEVLSYQAIQMQFREIGISLP